MSSETGKRIHISLFGESHGPAIGVTIDGLPAGEALDWSGVEEQMMRRAPGRDKSSTPRKERDSFEVLSGVYKNKTTGAPLCAMIRNEGMRSGDYAPFERTPRPSHADYPAAVRYNGHQDVRGGGHFSGRLTAPLVFAGAVCRQILYRRGIVIGGHIRAVGAVSDEALDPVAVSGAQLLSLSKQYFPVLSAEAGEAMRREIEAARSDGDSVGGIVEVAAVGLPAGLGSPIFGGVENVLSALLFGIPAVKGVEFGDGFSAATQRGSQHNDPYRLDGEGHITTETNRHGGILGGITTGMPLLLRAAIKPTPSIALPQKSVELSEKKEVELTIEGRHDPCIVPRAVPAAEAAVAIGLLDLWTEGGRA